MSLQLSNSRSPSQLLGGEKFKNLAVCLAHQVARTLPHCTNTLIVANQHPLPTYTINKAFLAPMNVFEPLAADSFPRPITEEYPLKVSELSVFKKMLSLNSSKAMGPDGVPGWLLKENADVFAQPVADILNCSFQEARLPSSWKDADIAPVPKEKPIRDVNKHLRPISLTPVLSKLAEDYVVERYVKAAALARVDANQFGTVSGSNTTIARRAARISVHLLAVFQKATCTKSPNFRF